MSVMTVGIMTLVGDFNYGNRLQNYAVHYLLEERGFKAETIAIPDTFTIRAKRLIKKVLQIDRSPERLMSEERIQMFQTFNKLTPRNYLRTRKVYADLYSFYVIGSDQIWNPYFWQSAESAFLLEVPANRKIALSPSFGLSKLPPESVDIIQTSLDTFHRLSVRETTGIDIIHNLSDVPVIQLCDPTMAVPKQHWDEISRDTVTPPDDYIFVYLLGEEIDGLDNVIRYAKETFDTDIVIRLSDRSYQGEIDAGPSEFISLISNAKHIITNSFHGTLFSILFNKSFTALTRAEADDTSSRMLTLLGLFKLSHRLYGTESFLMEEQFAYETSLLDSQVFTFQSYLDEEIERMSFSR